MSQSLITLTNMRHVPVESSNVASIGYDAERLVLEVAFKSGGTYQYLGVLPEHYKALLNAESIGKHIHQHIRGRYDCVKKPAAGDQQDA